MGMATKLEKQAAPGPSPGENLPQPEGLIRTSEELEIYRTKLQKGLQADPSLVFDWETELEEKVPVLLGLYHPLAGAASISVKNALGFPTLPLEQIWESLGPFLTDLRVCRITQNGLFDRAVWRQAGGYEVPYGPEDFDSLVASWLVDPDPPHDLDSIAQKYGSTIRKAFSSFKGMLKAFKVRKTSEAPVPALAYYCEQDCKATYHVKAPLLQRIQDLNLDLRFEMACLPISEREMTYEGAPIDRPTVEKMREQYRKKCLQQEKKVYQLAGEPFNLNSPKQMVKILFEKQGLTPVKQTQKGADSADQEVLEELARKGSKLAQAILDYRKPQKLLSTYLDPFYEHSEKDGRIHANFNPCATRSGRYSSSQPSLQNVPRPDTDYGGSMAIRSCFSGGWWLVCDYSQAELRLMAHYSQDPSMLKVYREGGDIHRMTALKVFGVCDSSTRPRAKTINFSILYGIGAVSLAKQISVSVAEAKEYLRLFFASYPGILAYQSDVLAFARQYGYVRTLGGRLRWIPNLDSSDPGLANHAKNAASNTPIQGGIGDLMKQAMLKLYEEILPKYGGGAAVYDANWKPSQRRATLVLQVHDELVFQAEKRATLRALAKEVREAMLLPTRGLSVPFEVDGGIGKSWAEAKEAA